MKQVRAWAIVVAVTISALIAFVIIKDIGAHLYTSGNGARSDALYSLLIGAVAFALTYGVLVVWRLTQKDRTGVSYLASSKLSSKDIGKAGFTDLMFASSGGNIQKVTESLAKGVDVNSQDDQGKTALMYATMNGHIEIVTLLLQVNADASLKTKAGNEASWFAKKQGFKEIESLLIHASKK
jgi:ankyrin repeat protein